MQEFEEERKWKNVEIEELKLTASNTIRSLYDTQDQRAKKKYQHKNVDD
jgi:hypothetical protein